MNCEDACLDAMESSVKMGLWSSRSEMFPLFYHFDINNINSNNINNNNNHSTNSNNTPSKALIQLKSLRAKHRGLRGRATPPARLGKSTKC